MEMEVVDQEEKETGRVNGGSNRKKQKNVPIQELTREVRKESEECFFFSLSQVERRLGGRDK